MPYMLIFEGDQNGVIDVPLQKKEYLLGRKGGVADIKFENMTVSRSHAYIRFIDTHWFIEDAGSKAGTYLNGNKIKRNSLIKDGSTIQLGDVTIEFHLDAVSPKEQIDQTETLSPLDRKMKMSFREMPKAIRIQCRILDLKPDSIFAQGDTLLVGNGGIRLSTNEPIPVDSVIEMSIKSPNHQPKTFFGEIVAVLRNELKPEMCIKLHMPLNEHEFRKTIESCRRGHWLTMQEGFILNQRQAPRSGLTN